MYTNKKKKKKKTKTTLKCKPDWIQRHRNVLTYWGENIRNILAKVFLHAKLSFFWNNEEGRFCVNGEGLASKKFLEPAKNKSELMTLLVDGELHLFMSVNKNRCVVAWNGFDEGFPKHNLYLWVCRSWENSIFCQIKNCQICVLPCSSLTWKMQISCAFKKKMKLLRKYISHLKKKKRQSRSE